MSRFTWGTVTALGPLRVKLDGDTAAIGFTPDSLVDPRTLKVNDRVRCEILEGRLIVHGRSGGDVKVLGLGRRNLFRNARGRINQRGAVSATSLASGAYFVDGWKSGAASNTITWTGSDVTGRAFTVPASKSMQQDIEQVEVIPDDYVLVNFGTAQGRVHNVGATAPAYATASPTSPLAVAIDGTANIRGEFGPGTVINPALLRAVDWAGFFPDISLALDLAWCQRFYVVGTTYGGAAADNDYSVNAMGVSFPVPMRSSPTVIITGGGFDGHHSTPPTVGSGNATGFSAIWSGGAYRDIGARASVAFTASAEL